MSPSLIELFERVADGLLWVQAGGQIRHANGEARRLTALRTGDRLEDPGLLRAIQVAARARLSRLSSLPAGDRLQRCRVIPGMGDDDAFVLFSSNAAEDPAAEGADRLLRAVDQGLRAPLQAAHASLSIWREDPGPHETTEMAGQIETLLRGMERLVDLASLWTTEAGTGDERIELWPLLQQAWAEVEPLAMDRNVGVRFRTAGDTAALATIYGSTRWLRRAVVECLTSALQATPRGGQLEVAHRQDGARAAIVFPDCDLFADAAAGGSDAIALGLCRQVLALHGGTVAREDGHGDWAVDLPTGAPAVTQEDGLGIAQAQIYARDLAALMNRSRSRGQSASKIDNNAEFE
jgi:signal transduction histidine kinase